MFKVGDRVRYIGNETRKLIGEEGEVVSPHAIFDVKVRFDNGRYWGCFARNLELVNDSPVREVTRREIVAGEYGGIHVANHESGYVLLGFEVGGDVHMRSFNAEQLSELIHVASQIREVLEDV